MKPKCEKYYREDGSIETESWYLNNKLHRTNGPAVVEYRKDGSVGEEKWYLNGKHHRTDGPAYVCHENNMCVKIEEWCLNDKLHRTDGPAVIYYRKDGSVGEENWYLNDEYIIPEEHLIPIPKTEEEKIELINEIAFIEDGNDYIFIKEWLKKDKEFYKKYRMLIK